MDIDLGRVQSGMTEPTQTNATARRYMRDSFCHERAAAIALEARRGDMASVGSQPEGRQHLELLDAAIVVYDHDGRGVR